MSKSFNWWSRKFHRWGAILAAIPLAIVIISGLLLQVKKQVAWIQPPTMRGKTNGVSISWDQILEAAQADSNAAVNEWTDIERLDVRPNKGLVKIRCDNGWELQLDGNDASMLSSAPRRSDWIESIHDGSFFSEAAKLWLFLPNGILLLLLWVSGLYLWYLPFGVKRSRNKRISNHPSAKTSN